MCVCSVYIVTVVMFASRCIEYGQQGRIRMDSSSKSV